jgi:hypothetical protein
VDILYIHIVSANTSFHLGKKMNFFTNEAFSGEDNKNRFVRPFKPPKNKLPIRLSETFVIEGARYHQSYDTKMSTIFLKTASLFGEGSARESATGP